MNYKFEINKSLFYYLSPEQLKLYLVIGIKFRECGPFVIGDKGLIKLSGILSVIETRMFLKKLGLINYIETGGMNNGSAVYKYISVGIEGISDRQKVLINENLEEWGYHSSYYI